MACSINTIKELRDALQEGIKTDPLEVGAVAPTGESFDLTNAFYKRMIGLVRDPNQVLLELEGRIETQQKPFQKNLRREAGEVLYGTLNGKEQEMYLMDSYLVQNPDALGGTEVVVRLVAKDNLVKTTDYRFQLNSDTSIKGIDNPEIVIPGLSKNLQRALLRTVRQAKSKRSKKPTIDSEGDKDLKHTLQKMVEGNRVLGTVQDVDSWSLVGFEKIPNYEHGNVDSMKELLVRLHVLGNSKAPESLISYYTQLIESMHPRFFNEMEFFLSTKGVKPFGQVNMNTRQARIAVAPKANVEGVQSEAEVYIHELVHTMTAWAFEQKDVDISSIRTQLNHAMEVTRKNLKWEDFLSVPPSKATRKEKEEAQKLMEYIFGGETSLQEFIAYTLTNPKLMEKTKTIKITSGKGEAETVFEKVLEFFGKLLNVITGRFNFRDNEMSIFDKVNELSFKLAEVNTQQVEKLSTMNPIGTVMDTIRKADEYTSDKIKTFINKVKNTEKTLEKLPENASTYQTAKWYIEAGVKAFTNPIHRGFMGLLISKWGLKPDSTLREIVGGFFEKDEAFRAAEFIKLASDRVEALRNSVINATSTSILNRFSRKLSEEEDIAITNVLLSTNLASLRYKRIGKNKRPDTETRRLLSDSDYRYQQIGRLKARIADIVGNDKERSSWIIAQATGLGYFMVTGKANIVQLFNGRNIAIGYGMPARHKLDKNLETVIEELASVTSINYLEKKEVALVVDLMKSEKAGIDFITDSYEAYRVNSKEHLFKDTQAHAMLGHVAEKFDDTIDLTVAPASKQTELEAKGYKLQYLLEPKNGDTYTSPMALYTTDSWGKASRVRGAIRLGKLHTKGTTLQALKRVEDPALAEITFGRDFARVSSEALKVHRAMMDGTFDVTKVSHGMAPVIDPAGNVVDYRYMMSKAEKKRLLGQDLRASQVLPRSSGSITDQVKAEEINKSTLEIIKQDMKENWISGEVGKNGYTEYVLIGPNSTDPKMRELYAMLPETFQKFITSRSDKTMAVRTELLKIYLGGKDFKLSSAPGLKLLPPVIRSLIDMVEGMWQELVKISKGAILLKMPLILISNLLSNIAYQISIGSLDIPQLLKDYKNSYRELNEYLNYNRKATALRTEIAADEEAVRRVRNPSSLRDKIANKKIELARLEQTLKNNPAHELFIAGMYQTHIEDMENTALGEANRLAKGMNSRLEKAPVLVRGAAELAYLTQSTAWYKFSQEALQRTDMITRMVDNKRGIREEIKAVKGEIPLPDWWVESKEKGYPKTKKLPTSETSEFLSRARIMRHRALLDRYVNYSLPNGTAEEYLNKMGVLMFTKYLKRIQAVIANSSVNHPVKTALTLATVGTFTGIDTVQEQALLARGFDPQGEFSLSNIVPVYSPLYQLENVLFPALFKEELRMNLF